MDGQIGSFTYMRLKSIAPDDLSDEQRALLSEYEERSLRQRTPEQVKFSIKYLEKLNQVEEESFRSIEKNGLWRLFNHYYYIQNKRPYELTSDSLMNIATIMHYFLRDKKFFESPHLSNISEPSFDKGLLLIGGYGNGKSSVMMAMQSALADFNHYFAFKNMNNVVSDYESCQEAHEKNTFWYYTTSGNCCFDDVKTERLASNYGKVNIFKDIFEKRDLNPLLKTHITCNYNEEYPFDVLEGIREFGSKYTGRVYDRIIHRCNIVEFKGKSFRK